MKVLVAILIVIVLVGFMLVPIAKGYVEAKTDNVVGALSDESVSFAAAWASALRITSKMWGSDTARKLLSNESMRCESVDFRVEINSIHDRNAVISLDSGTVIMSTRMDTVAQMQLAFIFYDSISKIHLALKERSEREFN